MLSAHKKYKKIFLKISFAWRKYFFLSLFSKYFIKIYNSYKINIKITHFQ